SSKRRYTRSKRDWSSDVCSTDLSRSRGQHTWANDRNIRQCKQTLHSAVFTKTTMQHRENHISGGIQAAIGKVELSTVCGIQAWANLFTMLHLRHGAIDES